MPTWHTPNTPPSCNRGSVCTRTEPSTRNRDFVAIAPINDPSRATAFRPQPHSSLPAHQMLEFMNKHESQSSYARPNAFARASRDVKPERKFRRRSVSPVPGPSYQKPYARSPRAFRRQNSKSPPPRSRSPSPKMRPRNPKGKGSRSACPTCLGRFQHDVRNCASETLWDGHPAHCTRSSDGTLTNPKGHPVCTDWQRPFGCRLRHAAALHECSGCGSSDHGAQACSKTQK